MISSKSKFAGLNIVILLIGLFVFSGCSSRTGDLQFIKSNEAMKKMENEETFVVYLGSSKCSYCIKYKAELEKLVKNEEVIIYGVILDEDTKEDATALMSQLELSGTPTTYYVKQGIVVDELFGNVKSREIIRWLKKNKLL